MTRNAWGLIAIVATSGFVVVLVVWALVEIGTLARETREGVSARHTTR